jgi:hypothetical protein
MKIELDFFLYYDARLITNIILFPISDSNVDYWFVLVLPHSCEEDVTSFSSFGGVVTF